MKRIMATAVAVAALALGGEAFAGLLGVPIPGLGNDGGAVGTFTCNQRAAVADFCASEDGGGITPDSGGKFWQVCINDFTYYPPIITPREGDVVAWVNVEKCADPLGGPVNVAEGLFAD